MLSEETLARLSTLTYRPDAERHVCILPLGSIHWDDELPQNQLIMAFPEPDRNEVLRAFAIRMKLWNQQPLSDDDRELWDSVRSAAPNWAIFRRLDLSDDDRREREGAERACRRDLLGLLASADEVTFRDEGHGIWNFSAKFRLDKSQPGMSDRPNKTSRWERWCERWSLRLKRFTNR